MKILICFNSNELSNSIASSAIHHFKEENHQLDRVNIDKYNIVKYIKKHYAEELPVVYVYDKRENLPIIARLNVELPDVKVLTYDANMAYRPARVPGNKLKEVIYMLHEAIKLDIEHDFKTHEVYKVKSSENEIELINKSSYDMFHERGNKLNCFFTKKEALERLKWEQSGDEALQIRKVAKLRDELVAEMETLTTMKQENKQALIDLMNNLK